MSKILLIIITGLPGTGKTTLGKRIAEEFHLPFFSKDDIKEFLFDGFGWDNRETSKRIGMHSFSLMYYIAESLLKANKPLIVETNFKPEYDNKKFLDLKEKYNFEPFQIRCITNGEILFERFKKRAKSNDRHPGHVDDISLAEWKPILLKGKIEALNIGGKIFDIDTSDFNCIDYVKLFGAIKSATNSI